MRITYWKMHSFPLYHWVIMLNWEANWAVVDDFGELVKSSEGGLYHYYEHSNSDNYNVLCHVFGEDVGTWH